MIKAKLLALALLIWGAGLLQAQNLDHAYSLQAGKYDKYLKKWNWSKAEDVDLNFSFDGNYIKIHDEYGTRIYTYEDEGETSGYDDDGDRFSRHVWKALDEKNRKCMFIMLWYKNIKLVTYTVMYSDYAFRYYITTQREL